MQITPSRRDFITGLTAAAATGLIGTRGPLADEGPPEVSTVRLGLDPAICVAPWFIAEDLLRGEGFTDVQYVPLQPDVRGMIGAGDLDFTVLFVGAAVAYVDAGVPLVTVVGLHPGCFELFAHEPIRTISDLRGRRVVIDVLGAGKHVYMSVMAAHVGLDPQRDIEWIEGATMGPDALAPIELFINGDVDAFLGFPPEPQRLRRSNVGRVILNTTTEKPWSQYFCCVVVGNREFVQAHPVATKRVVRALLKANEVCAAEPERTARQLVERGFTEGYDDALETLSEIPYGAWREYDPEDALRFFALRLHQVGMITSSPNEILAEGTDWRFLEELKLELKT